MNAEIVSGSPSEEEEAAARAAILKLHRDDVAAAVRAAGQTPWTAAGRAQATGRSATVLRGRTPQAWRWAGRLSEPVSDNQDGRGDAR